MEKIAQVYSLHCFVCTNTKDKGESCGPKGAAVIRDELKDWIRNQGLHRQVRINNAGCLGQCEKGIAIALYPDNDWLLHVAPEDIEEIKEILSKHLPQNA